jgi:hypothetical protein
MRDDGTGRIALRAKEVAHALSKHDEKARAFAELLPGLLDHYESGDGAAA